MSAQEPGSLPSTSEMMTRVGPGTVMGDLMRRYWLPALAAGELKADGDPVRLLLLGERLLAFRDSSGRVGVVTLFHTSWNLVSTVYGFAAMDIAMTGLLALVAAIVLGLDHARGRLTAPAHAT